MADRPGALGRALREAIARGAGGAWFDRVEQLGEVQSTQDHARRLAQRRPGLVVVARRQTAGRGRQGRGWADTALAGLAMSLCVPADARPPAALAIALGLGVTDALRPLAPAARLGLRWPNDVVERTPNPDADHADERADDRPGRKLAGVLVEVDGPIAVCGVGVNVGQQRADWPAALRRSAVSLAQLGSRAGRESAACAVLAGVAGALSWDDPTLRARWREDSTLLGRWCELAITSGGDRQSVAGVAVGLDEAWRLVLDTARGRVRVDAGQAHLLAPRNAEA